MQVALSKKGGWIAEKIRSHRKQKGLDGSSFLQRLIVDKVISGASFYMY